MVGDEDGNFNPDKQVTRAEMATVMANLLDLNVDNFKGANLSFTDVPEWAVPYVAACAADGIVSGYDSTTFGSNDSVTAAQASLMVLKALGYFQNSTDFGSDWQLATVKQADKAELYDGLDVGATTALTRNDVAQLVLNALEATMVEVEGNSGVTISGNGFTISNGGTQYTDVLKSDSKYSKINDTMDGSKYTVELGESLFDGKLVKGDGKRDDLGRPGTKWTYKGDEIGTYGDEADYVVVLTDSYTSLDIEDILQDALDDDDLTTAAGVNCYLNGSKSAPASVAAKDVATYGTVYEVYVDEDDTDVITDVVAYYYQLDQIDDVDDDVTTSDAKKGVSSYVSFGVTAQHNDNDIPGFDARTYVEDAYVALVINDEGEIVASALADEIEGSITTKKDGTSITLTVGGTKYRTTAGYIDNLDSDLKVIYDSISTDSDDNYALYLDPNGYVIGLEGVESSTNLKDVYYVDSVWDESVTLTGGKDGAEYYAQIVNVTDGSVSEIQLEADAKNADVDKANQYGKYTDGNWAGQLVTISDKKWTNDGTTYKASNGKYDLEVWSDSNYDVATAGGKYTVNLSKSDVRTIINSKTYRLNSSTVYVFAEGTGDDLDTSIYTGGVSYKDEVNNAIVITEDGSLVAKYILFLTDDADQSAEYSEDMIYIKSDSPSAGDGFYTQTVYYLDGGVVTSADWDIDDGEYTNGALTDDIGFYTYDINSDGYYVLEKADPMSITVGSDGSYSWDEDEGVLEDVIFDDADDLFGTLLSVTLADGKTKYIDIETSGAAFKDVRASSKRNNADQYTNVVSSLSRVATLVDNKSAVATLQLNVSEDGAVMILLTSLEIPTT
jgi:hypothetical protein